MPLGGDHTLREKSVDGETLSFLFGYLTKNMMGRSPLAFCLVIEQKKSDG